jgi:hypothetical protein
MNRCSWGIALVAACIMSSVAQAEPLTTLSDGAVGHIELRTYTPASQRVLITRAYLNEPATVIDGVLSLPTDATLQREGKSPAVILAHGTGGLSDEREHAWAKRLNTWGMAAFVVDRVTGRGIKPPMYISSTSSWAWVCSISRAPWAACSSRAAPRTRRPFVRPPPTRGSDTRSGSLLGPLRPERRQRVPVDLAVGVLGDGADHDDRRRNLEGHELLATMLEQ